MSFFKVQGQSVKYGVVRNGSAFFGLIRPGLTGFVPFSDRARCLGTTSVEVPGNLVATGSDPTFPDTSDEVLSTSILG